MVLTDRLISYNPCVSSTISARLARATALCKCSNRYNSKNDIINHTVDTGCTAIYYWPRTWQ